MATGGKIRKLFERRDEVFEKYTLAIKDALTPNVLSAIIEVLDLDTDDMTRLDWHYVRLIDEHVMLSGVAAYDAGDIIHDDQGEEVTLDENMALAFTKLIRIALPIKVIERATKDEIIEYLRAIEERYRKEYAEIYGEAPSIKGVDLSQVEGETIEEKLRNASAIAFDESHVEDPDEFVYTDLTEEQKESLRLSRLTQQGKGTKAN